MPSPRWPAKTLSPPTINPSSPTSQSRPASWPSGTAPTLASPRPTLLKTSNSRARTEKNHTSTHLANWALREVLGDDVQQKGSLVDPEKLRFDFSHPKSLADEELARVETLVNESIGKTLPVYAEVAPQE